MASYQSASESAIKRAHELLAEGAVDDALKTLNDFITGKKKIAAQPSSLEKVMVEYIDICAKNAEIYQLKEIIVHYRNICQHSHDDNIRSVINHYRKRIIFNFKTLLASKENAEAAATQLKQLESIQDLEGEETPGELLLMSVSDSEGLLKGAIIVQNIKFVWQSFKIMIDLLKMNSKMLELYQTLCCEAFDFMVLHHRTKEAKKIFDLMSAQVKAAQKMEAQPLEYEGIPNRIELSRYEHLIKMLDLRYILIGKALNLHYYAECWKAYDDLLYLSKRFETAAKEEKLNTGKYEQLYYIHLSELVRVAEFPLHHAFALYREYHILDIKKRKWPAKDREELVSLLIMAVLATPPHTSSHLVQAQMQKNFRFLLGGETVLSSFDVEAHYNKRVTDMFMVSGIPSRDVIIKDVHRRNLLLVTNSNISKLFNLLESETKTANFAKDAMNTLNQIVAASPQLAIYAEAVKQTIGIRVIEKVGKYYKKVRFEKLKQWMPENITEAECEKLIVSCNRAGNVRAVIDYNNKVIVLDSLTAGQTENRQRLSEFTQGLKYTSELITKETKNDILNEAKERLYNKIVEKIPVDVKEVDECINQLKKQKEEREGIIREEEKEEVYVAQPGEAPKTKEQKKERTVRKQRKDMEKERLNKTIVELTEQKKQKLKEAILKIKPKIKFNGKKLSSIPTGDITLKDLESLKDLIGKTEEKTLTDFIKQEVKRRDTLVRALREGEAEVVLPQWEAQTAKIREFEKVKADERKKEHDEHVNSLTPIQSILGKFEIKYKERKVANYKIQLQEKKKAAAIKYKEELIKRATNIMLEEEKKEKEKAKEAEALIARQETGEEKALKQGANKYEGLSSENPENVKITRAAPKKVEEKKEEVKKGEAKEEEKKKEEPRLERRKDEKPSPDKKPEEIPKGMSWRNPRKEEKKTVKEEEKKIVKEEVKKQESPVKVEVKKQEEPKGRFQAKEEKKKPPPKKEEHKPGEFAFRRK